MKQLIVFLMKYTVLVYLSNFWVSESHSRNINMTAIELCSLPVHETDS